MRIFGIEFAPFFIPLERRIQTFAVAQWFFSMSAFPSIGMFLFICCCIFLTPLAILYVIWVYFFDFKTPKRGGRRSKWWRNLRIWGYYRDYFPIKLVKTADLDPNKNYIFGYHPHGIIVCSAVCNFCTEATGFSDVFPGIKPTLLTLESNFYFPLYREYFLAFGACDASRESITYLLTKSGVGNAVVIVVGGADEALEARPESFKLTLKNRKGFVKMAIETGTSLVPCFAFRENELFCQVSNPKGSILRSFQDKFKKIFHVAPPFYYGRGIFNYTFGFMPFRKPLTTVIGEPIDVIKNASPTKKEVDELHERYLESLYNLFEEHKTTHGIESDKHLLFQ